MITTLIVSLAASGGLWLKGLGLNGKLNRLGREIESTERQTVEILSTLPRLREMAKEVVAQANRKFAPSEDPEPWCAQLFNNLYIERSFNMALNVRGLKIPFGMDMPWNLRQIGAHVYPALAPCRVKVDLLGSPAQIIAFLREFDRYSRCMVVGRMELAPAEEQGDRLEGTATLIFPQLFHAEDLIQIQQFVQE